MMTFVLVLFVWGFSLDLDFESHRSRPYHLSYNDFRSRYAFLDSNGSQKEKKIVSIYHNKTKNPLPFERLFEFDYGDSSKNMTLRKYDQSFET